MTVYANNHKTPSFETASTKAIERSDEASMHAVNRDRSVPGQVMATSDVTRPSSSGSPMLQRWEKETFREQPFNNVGAVSSVTSDNGHGRKAGNGNVGGNQGS